MSAPSFVPIGVDLPDWERVRMCVAEAGYPPEAILPPTRPGGAFNFTYEAIPLDVEWKAREVAGVNAPLCRACASEYDRVWRATWDWPVAVAVADACRAERRLEQDCGVPR